MLEGRGGTAGCTFILRVSAALRKYEAHDFPFGLAENSSTFVYPELPPVRYPVQYFLIVMSGQRTYM